MPCQSFLRKYDGEILRLTTTGGVTVGQDCFYLPVENVIEEIRKYPVEESEDERIRKELLLDIPKVFPHDKAFRYIAYLEKQGEQKLYVNDNAKEMFIKALERVEEQNAKGYKLTDCDKNSWWEDFKNYTSCTIEQKPILDVEIPFGAKDSELEEVTYDIPKGYHAEIEDNKVVIKKGNKKSSWSEEDEIMHKTIILNLKVQMENCAVPSKDSLNKAIGWFQKLKHQRTFVPSEEEMKALEFCLEHNIDKDGVFGSKVVKLYKKIKETYKITL